MFALLAMVSTPSCNKHHGNASEAQPVAAERLPDLRLEDEMPHVLLTWVDAKGNAHIATKPADVPVEGRDQVRVVVEGREDGTQSLFYVANLTVKGSDGTYPVSTRTRDEWDAMIASRRAPLLASISAPGSATLPEGGSIAETGEPPRAENAPGARPTIGFTVIVYGASWCGACHQAVAYLKQRRVPVIEKDVEEDPAAQQEMQKKLARIGMRGGSIPIIDVHGKILVGFEPHALEQAISAAGGAPI